MIWVVEQSGYYIYIKTRKWGWWPQSFYTTRKAARKEMHRYIDKLNLDGKVRVRKYERVENG